MNADRSVVFLFVLAGLMLLVGVAAAWRVLTRAHWVPRRFFDFVALAGALFSVSVGVTLIYGALQLRQNMRAAFDLTGKTLPEFRYSIAGTEHSSAEWQGKPVLLNLWATWCEPCRTELDALRKLAPSDVAVIALSDEGPKLVTPFLEKHSYAPLAIGYSKAPWLQEVPVRPYTLLIDRQGIVRESRAGATEPGEFEKLIAPYRDGTSGSSQVEPGKMR